MVMNILRAYEKFKGILNHIFVLVVLRVHVNICEVNDLDF